MNIAADQLRGLQEAAIACERIIDTPIPTAYTRHISRFLSAWLTVLPLALWSDVGMATPITSITIAYFVLGFEDLAGLD